MHVCVSFAASLAFGGPEVIDTILNRVLKNKEKVLLSGAIGSSRAAFIASVLKKTGRTILLVVDNNDRAENLKNDISFFLKYFHTLAPVPPVLFFPDWEVLPYEPISPVKEISGQRIEVLENLLWQENPYVLIVTVESLLQKVLPKSVLARQVFRISVGDEISVDTFRQIAVNAGYQMCDLVERQGEASVRGCILDIFPSNSDFPFRIELFGDDVDSIRAFDPASQRSVRNMKELRLLPSAELIIEPDGLKLCIDRLECLKDNDSHLATNPEDIDVIVAAIREGIPEPGVERYAPYFYQKMESLFNYVDKDRVLVIDSPELVMERERSYGGLIQNEFRNSGLRGEFFPSPDLFYEKAKYLSQLVEREGAFLLQDLNLDSDSISYPLNAESPPRYNGDVEKFLFDQQKKKEAGFKTIITFRAKGQGERIFEVLTDYGAEAALYTKDAEKRDLRHDTSALCILQGSLTHGAILSSEKLFIITEEELYGVSRSVKKRRKRTSESFSSGLKNLKPGEYLVHVEHGIGRYTGTREITHKSYTEEFLAIEYANDNRLLIPMYGLKVVQRYKGAEDGQATLSKLGGTAWQKTKKRVKKALLQMADELLKLGATRALLKGHSFSKNGHFHKEFADSFEYEETDDQLRSIEEITLDMEKETPMDRLVCGDVGYGKTEVAMRAVFKAVMDQKQVALLVPTTLLAQQHLETFRARFHAFPINIDMLSRFRSPLEQKKIIEKLKNGNLDVILGTHRILQKDIVFKDLGLVIVDEEQRFGVAHKEKLKKIREKTDILTLTATPIPRTLHFAMSGVRDLSVIDTPPQNRLSIKTFIKRFDDETIRQAITRELDRDGQVFFLDNRVETIHSTAEYLKNLIPEIKIGIAHGQLHKHELEHVMVDFIEKRVNVLVCTTIVESGLDIPSANTIIINRAHKFGLAQLYQLRGRVGRDRHQAFAYLLVPSGNLPSTVAMKRLTAIEELSDLGSGFQVAARDLEIRGAGNLLGSEQSGQIAAIGFDFYCRLMEDTIRELKGEAPIDDYDPSINLSLKGFIPKEFVSDLNQRLDLYKRVDGLDTREEIQSFGEELRDRYGNVPEPVEKLLAQRHMKALCVRLKVEKVECAGSWLVAQFMDDTPVTHENILDLMKTKDGKIRLKGESGIMFACPDSSWKGRYRAVELNFTKIIKRLPS